MNPLKILTIAGWTYPDAEGGSFRFIYELNRALAKRGHDVAVLTQRLDDLPPHETIHGIRFIRYATDTRSTAAFYRSTYAGVKRKLERIESEYDVIHLHHPVSAFAAARSKTKKPMLHTLHIAYFREYIDRVTAGRTGLTGGQRLAAFLLRRMEYYTLRRCRRVVVLSEFVKRQAAEYYPDAAQNIAVIPGGVDTELFNTSLAREEARRLLGLPDDKPVLLTVRRLEPRMGLDNLIDAMPAIRGSLPGCVLLIGGRGSLDADLREQAAEMNLSDAVRFCGFIENDKLPAYYRAADLFVLPTRALEGFGMVTLEAFACGTPAVVTPAGGAPEVVAPVDTGLVADGVEPDQIAKSVINFFSRPDRNELGQRCRAYAESFTWHRIAQLYEEIYREIISDTGVEN